MRKLLALSYVILVAGFACLAHAQLTQTGAGKVGGGGGGGGYVGPGDIVGSAYFWGGFRAYSAAKRGTKAVNICNPTPANCVDVNSDAVTGKVVITAGTVVGTDCTAAIGNCVINTIYDQSGNGRDIASHINAPPLNATGCTTSFQPCAHFVAANNTAFITTALTLTQPFSFSYWAKNTNVGVAEDFLYSSTVTCSTNLVINRFNRNPAGAANQMSAYAGTFQDVTVNDSAWNGIGVLYNGATGKVSVNGTPTTLSLGTDTGNSEPWAIGMDCSFSANKWNGDFTEIGAWSSDISASFSSLSTNQSGFY